ncbi:MAG TPA: ATP-binding protein [Terriglobales bacterium]|nr:ATP-binding protein [Terriglobales bacterium]
MHGVRANLKGWIARHRHSTWLCYGGAALAVWVALCLWTFSPVLHRHPFAILLAAVLFTTRFLGFGPAVFSSLLAVMAMDFFVVPPYFSFGIQTSADFERLSVFVVISMFGASMARQKSLAESRADRSAREMAAIVQYSRDAMYSASPDGIITSWNNAAEHLYGLTAEEAVGSPVTRLAPPERHLEVERNREILNSGGHVGPYRTERVRKDGTRWPVMLSITPLQNSRGKIVGSSAIARDLSAEKVSEEAIRRTEKLATAGRLAASIAHEINNPLEAVVNLLYLVRHDPSHADDYLNLAEQEVARVAQLAQQTLGFVRDTNSPDSMNPSAIMDEVLQLYSRKLQSKHVVVVRDFDGACRVSGFSGELRQLLANLLVNAIDAMPEARSEAKPQVTPEESILQVRVAKGRDWSTGREGVRIIVADNGSGIPRDHLEQIFQPFYTTKKGTGTGLGLWVSRGIVQKHGGSIRVRSRSGGHPTGTVFLIFLPQQQQVTQVA